MRGEDCTIIVSADHAILRDACVKLSRYTWCILCLYSLWLPQVSLAGIPTGFFDMLYIYIYMYMYSRTFLCYLIISSNLSTSLNSVTALMWGDLLSRKLQHLTEGRKTLVTKFLSKCLK